MITRWVRIRALVRRLLHRDAWERGLDDELRAYVEHEIDARIAGGMTPGDARRTALADLGGLEPVRERVRAGATGAWLDALWKDVGYACRAVRQGRAHALWVIGSLAIGMAVMTAALALLNALLVRAYPGVSDQERLVRVSVSRNCGRPDCWTRMSSPAAYDALRKDLAGLQDLAAYAPVDLAVGLPEAQSMRGLLVSANYFEVLGVRAVVGRTYDARDEHTAVAVLAHSVWTGQLGGDPSVVGRSIRVADEIVEIVGVAPPFFVGVDRSMRPGARFPEIWLPLWLAGRVSAPAAAGNRRQEHDFSFVGRLRTGVDVRHVQTEADVLAARLAIARDEHAPASRAEVLPVWMTRPEHRPLLGLLVLPIPILVLVIACVNAANLMLARGSQRAREMAIRLAIGASRGRVIRQLLFESLLLALAATVLAVPLASWALDVAGSPHGLPMPLDGTVLALAVLTAAGTAVAAGLVPAFRATAVQPAAALGPAAGGGATSRQARARRALVVAQVALSIGLLATAWQLVATLRAAGGSAGTPADRLLIARFDLAPLALPDAGAEVFYHRLLEGARRLPGSGGAGLARHTAVWTFGQGMGPASLVVWQQDDGPQEGRMFGGGYAAGELFEAVGLRVLHGRAFTEGERHGRPRVAVVNEALADRLDRPALGQILRVAPREQELTSAIHVQVVGVVESALEPRHGIDDGPAPKVYLPSPTGPEPALALYVRSHTTAAALAQPVRDLVQQIDARVPILEIGSLDEINERSLAPQLWLARGAAILGVIGLLLATAGLYGVASYVVSMRAREIAIRMAIGARPGRVLAMVLGQSMRLALIGLVAGGLAAFIASRVIQAEFHGLQGMDVTAFGGSAALFTVAMLLASGLPALRAARVDPVANLKDL
jgi:predicted permease